MDYPLTTGESESIPQGKLSIDKSTQRVISGDEKDYALTLYMKQGRNENRRKWREDLIFSRNELVMVFSVHGAFSG